MTYTFTYAELQQLIAKTIAQTGIDPYITTETLQQADAIITQLKK